MGLFGTKKDEKPSIGTAAVPEIESALGSVSQVRAADAASSPSGRVGIDHAIQLIRSLPTDKNVDLVVTVLKTTLESLGIRVGDIVNDAAQRETDIQGRVGLLKSEIEHLEKDIEQRTQEIGRLDVAYAETTRVRLYLEDRPVELAADDAVSVQD